MQIIPKKIIPVETRWQKELANSFNNLESLLEYLEIDKASVPQIQEGDANVLSINGFELHDNARKLFPLRVPRTFAELMQKGDWNDPLLQQVLPQAQEFADVHGYVEDPLQEQDNPVSGLIHKYKSRVLLLVRGACAVNCRYCFRRHFPYQDNHIDRQQIEKLAEYVQCDSAINEVILSGGDPLMANDNQLAYLLERIEAIPHVKRLRIHSRLPVVIPQRITNEFVSLLKSSRLQTVVVTHVNHANEISPLLMEKTTLLKNAGVTLLNQAVLLKHINDSASTQVALSEKLFEANILPYYLHLFDPVKGAAHFDVPKAVAKQIMANMLSELPGFLVPRLVKEIPNRSAKTPIDLNLE